jgi:Fic family protein
MTPEFAPDRGSSTSIVLLLCEWGILPQPLLDLSVYFESHRQEYYDHLLAVSQRGAWEEWLRFFLRGVSSQAQEGVRRLEGEPGTTFAAAKRYIEKLVEAGVLQEVTGHARNRIFRAHEIYKALEGGGE